MKTNTLLKKTGAMVFGLALMGLVGCAGVKTVPDPSMMYPSDQGKPSVKFLENYTSSDDVAKDFLSNIVLGKDTQYIIKPFGVEMDKGKLYVADIVAGYVHVFDLKNNKYQTIGQSGYGKLGTPFNLAIGEDGTIYVADGKKKFVYKYDKDYKFIGAIGSFDNPVDVAVHKDRVYVADINQDEIEVWTKDSKKLFTIKNDKMGLPVSIDIEGGILYVGNSGSCNIQKYDLEGKLLKSGGESGDRPGNFVRIKGIDVEEGLPDFGVKRLIGVSDFAIQRIQLLNDDLELLTFFADPGVGPGDLSGPAGIFVTSDKENLEVFDKKEYIPKGYKLRHIIGVANQFGKNKVNIYALIQKE